MPDVNGDGRADLLVGCVRAVRDSGGDVLWCRARLAEVRLYEREGLADVGDVFDIADVGPHIVTWRGV